MAGERVTLQRVPCLECGLSPGLCDCAPVLRTKNGAGSRIPTPFPVSETPKVVDPVSAARHSSSSDAQIERRVLGALLLVPERLASVRLQIGADVFSQPLRQMIFAGMCGVADAGERIGLMTLMRALPHVPIAEIGRLSDEPTPAYLDTDVAKLKKLAVRRGLETVADELRDVDHTMGEDELLERARTGLIALDRVACAGGKAQKRSLSDALSVTEMSVTPFLNKEPPKLDWIVDNMIPSCSTGMFAAAGGTGKGHLTIQLALAVGCGIRFGPFAVQRPRGILCVSREDDRGELHRRFRSGVDAQFISGMDDDYRSLAETHIRLADMTGIRSAVFGPELLEALIRAAKETPDCGLIVLDPLSKLIPATAGISLNSQEGAGLIHSFADEIRVETGCTVLLVHHVNKAAKRDKKENDSTAPTGSLQLVDNARWLINMRALEEEDVAKYGLRGGQHFLEMRGPKYNYGPGFAGPVFWRRSAGGALIHVAAPNQTQVDMDRCFDALADLGAPADRAVLDKACLALGISLNRSRAARQELITQGRIRMCMERTGKGGAPKRLFEPVFQGKDSFGAVTPNPQSAE